MKILLIGIWNRRPKEGVKYEKKGKSVHFDGTFDCAYYNGNRYSDNSSVNFGVCEKFKDKKLPDSAEFSL
jgi:hypothetical protein